MVIFVWSYTLPWAIMPMLDIWGRFVPGKVSEAVIREVLLMKNCRKVENGCFIMSNSSFLEV